MKIDIKTGNKAQIILFIILGMDPSRVGKFSSIIAKNDAKNDEKKQ